MAEYISRDLALSFPFANGEYDHKNADPHFIGGCETYREWLESLPAADVAEVRHGRWVSESYYAGPIKMCGWKCTACGAFSPVNEVKFYKFCPGCGANMCEEGKDGQTT